MIIFLSAKNHVYICFKKICHKRHILKKTLDYHGFVYVANFFKKNKNATHYQKNPSFKPFSCGEFFLKNATFLKK